MFEYCGRCRKGVLQGLSSLLHHGKGSAAELATQLQIAQEIGLILDGSVEKRILETEEIARMLNSLIKSVKAKGSKH